MTTPASWPRPLATGHDGAPGSEDLVQTAFVKLYLVWNRVARHEVLDAYVRQILIRTFLDERRRGWWRRERVGGQDAERPIPPDSPESRLVVLQ